jgi:hypothetical protein
MTMYQPHILTMLSEGRPVYTCRLNGEYEGTGLHFLEDLKLTTNIQPETVGFQVRFQAIRFTEQLSTAVTSSNRFRAYLVRFPNGTGLIRVFRDCSQFLDRNATSIASLHINISYAWNSVVK